MQKSNELLLSIAEKNNGVIRYSDVEEKDISKDAFFRFIKNNDFEKVSHGIYLSPDVFPDEMFLLQLRFPRIVFSNETALYLHNLSDMEPSPLSVTVLTGYNSANLEAMGIKITHCKAEFYEIGLSEILSNSGNVLRVYDKERTMCDIIKKRNELDVSLFNNAIREYAFRSDKKLNNLFHYAKEMNMEKTVRKTIEILL